MKFLIYINSTKYMYSLIHIKAVVAQRPKGAVVVGSILIRGNELLFFNIFIFSLTPRQNPRVEFCHSTRNVSKITAESGEL